MASRNEPLGVFATTATHYRSAKLDDFDYLAGSKPAAMDDIVYFEPSAYLNGTEKPDSFKWLVAGRVGKPGRVLRLRGTEVHGAQPGRQAAAAGDRLVLSDTSQASRVDACQLAQPGFVTGGEVARRA